MMSIRSIMRFFIFEIWITIRTKDAESVNNSMYHRLGATPASTAISTDTEAAREMFNLSMGLPELLVTREASDSAGPTYGALSDDDQFADMFKTPKALPKAPVPRNPPSSRPRLDPWILMAEVKFKSGRRTLPPPQGL